MGCERQEAGALGEHLLRGIRLCLLLTVITWRQMRLSRWPGVRRPLRSGVWVQTLSQHPGALSFLPGAQRPHSESSEWPLSCRGQGGTRREGPCTTGSEFGWGRQTTRSEMMELIRKSSARSRLPSPTARTWGVMSTPDEGTSMWGDWQPRFGCSEHLSRGRRPNASFIPALPVVGWVVSIKGLPLPEPQFPTCKSSSSLSSAVMCFHVKGSKYGGRSPKLRPGGS